MDREQVRAVYDEEYARTYEERFTVNDAYAHKTAFETRVLGELLAGARNWLDVACGTGYFLSRFRGVERAGIDLAPAMLRLAREANPDAMFLKEHDFTEDVPEWHGRWDVVSCMWYSYGLVESLAAVARVIANLAAWTSDVGACFVPICDPQFLAPSLRVPYFHRNVGFPPGDLLITSLTWTWIEDSGKVHRDMVAPAVEWMVTCFEEHFDSVELVPYPRRKWLRPSHMKAIVARRRR